MSGTHSNRKFALSCFLCLWLLVVAVTAEKCDKSKCRGPLRYYEELKCKPIYKNPGDCCAVSYDCSHLYNRSPNKCYANGHAYNLGERMRKEDQINPCDQACHCGKDNTGVVRFFCAIIDCFPMEAKPGCYIRPNLDSCCQREEICPKNPEERYKCDVDGRTYYDGERFTPKGQPTLLCQCMEGYKGQNVAPFCRKSSCGLEEKRPSEIRKNCAPIFENNQSPANTCNSFFRCQNANDSIIRSTKPPNKNGTCKYGNLKLRIGDELNENKEDFRSKCVQCTCEVPPTLTCKRLTNEKCEIKYPQN